MATARGVPVFVDPAADRRLLQVRRRTRPSRPTAPRRRRRRACPAPPRSQYRPVAERLLHDLGLEAAVLTLDKNGIYVATPRRRAAIGSRRRERKVYDVAGAGDMVLAMLAVGAGGGGELGRGGHAGQHRRAGWRWRSSAPSPSRPHEIVQELLTEAHDHLGKRRDAGTTPARAAARTAPAGKRIVFTNGCFDLIHLGHVKYFRFAKEQGDLLVVGVNTDASIRRLKGPKRPIINEDDRLSVLEELESIDYLVQFDEDTPLELIEAIRPDVLVKGADYAKEQVVGWDVVEAYGGRVALAPLVDGRSTSNVIERILEAYAKPGGAEEMLNAEF